MRFALARRLGAPMRESPGTMTSAAGRYFEGSGGHRSGESPRAVAVQCLEQAVAAKMMPAGAAWRARSISATARRNRHIGAGACVGALRLYYVTGGEDRARYTVVYLGRRIAGMSGIYGLVLRRRRDREAARAMHDAMSYWGPDGGLHVTAWRRSARSCRDQPEAAAVLRFATAGSWPRRDSTTVRNCWRNSTCRAT
jgi:hypothetical protein